jgi:hypothetical protein
MPDRLNMCVITEGVVKHMSDAVIEPNKQVSCSYTAMSKNHAPH